MTKRLLLIGLVVLILVTAFVAVWMRSGNSQLNSQRPPSKDATAKVAATKTISPVPATPQSLLDRAEQTRALLEAGNGPITFWGKVVDEAGVGIPSVSIKYRLQRAGRLEANGTIAEDGVQASLTSNADGSFSIANASGTTLSMAGFTKDDYELSANQNSVFGYYGTPALHTPKQQSPQIFVMRSNKTQIDVSNMSQQISMPWDGKAFRIDLDTGSPSPSGKLVITASRTASTGRFGWSLTLAIDGGELQEAERGRAFIAPENACLPTWQCRYPADANPWRFGHDANIYYRLNGKFGRLKLQIYADAGPNDVSIHFEKFVNNSGGRNTEGRQ
jgi:hypothetical protein